MTPTAVASTIDARACRACDQRRLAPRPRGSMTPLAAAVRALVAMGWSRRAAALQVARQAGLADPGRAAETLRVASYVQPSTPTTTQP